MIIPLRDYAFTVTIGKLLELARPELEKLALEKTTKKAHSSFHRQARPKLKIVQQINSGDNSFAGWPVMIKVKVESVEGME